MNVVGKKRLLIVWLALSLITLVYLVMDYAVDRGGILRPSIAVTAVAIVIALVKLRVIFREYMEVRHAPVLLARLTDVWIAIIAISLFTSYALGVAAR